MVTRTHAEAAQVLGPRERLACWSSVRGDVRHSESNVRQSLCAKRWASYRSRFDSSWPTVRPAK